MLFPKRFCDIKARATSLFFFSKFHQFNQHLINPFSLIICSCFQGQEWLKWAPFCSFYPFFHAAFYAGRAARLLATVLFLAAQYTDKAAMVRFLSVLTYPP
jgi:hypothetical protein